jgi:hypothetical protein
MYYVYTLAYPDGRVFYIGKGTGDRIERHEQEARGNARERNPFKCNVIRKIWADGGQVVKTILAYFDTEQDAHMYEIALISLMDGLTNLTNGGEGISGLIHSEDARQKMSIAQKGKVKPIRSKTHCQKISNAHKGKARKFSEEHRRKLSMSGRGRIVSEETRRKIGEARKEYLISEEHRRKIGEARIGKTHSEETRRKMSDAHKGKPKKAFSEEHRRKLSETKKGKPGPNKGKVFSEEHRRKISEARKGKPSPIKLEETIGA